MSIKHIIYFSTKCNHCNKLLQIIESVRDLNDQFEFVNVENGTPLPNIIRSVPTILIEKNKLAQGRDAFAFVEEERKLYLDAFEHGFGNNQYSFIDTDGLCEGNNTFTYLTEPSFQPERISADQSQFLTRDQASQEKKSELEALVEKRNAEVPQTLNRC
tara:strand:- start:1678 stop:2154 length:477 start_codon:yes stop_codon:yes gene_type:complete